MDENVKGEAPLIGADKHFSTHEAPSTAAEYHIKTEVTNQGLTPEII